MMFDGIKGMLWSVAVVLLLVVYLSHGCGRRMDHWREFRREQQEHREQRWDHWREQRHQWQQDRQEHRHNWNWRRRNHE